MGDFATLERRAEPGPHGSRTLLLALTDSDYPTIALRQSSSLAGLLGLELHILRVLPTERPFLAIAPLDIAHVARRVQRCMVAARDTRAWCDQVLAAPLSAKQLRVRIGPFIEDVGSYANELNVAFITLAPSTGRVGARATTLARVSARSVLVVRTSTFQGTLLAATKLEDNDYWVVRRAVEFGSHVGASVVALHNCSPWPPRCAGSDKARPLGAQERCPIPVPTVVTHELDPVDAILVQARIQRAQTVVVGTRRSSWLGGTIEQGVAVEVIDRCERSVLVAPFDRSVPSSSIRQADAASGPARR
ncbi:MAG: universal stress protein [Deltaproteobacteria bacterium]